MKNKASTISRRSQTAILLLVAVFISASIFVVDVMSPSYIAIGTFYSVVILYSWLLPHRLSSIWMAFACSILVILAPYDEIPNQNVIPVLGINYILSLMVIWICASLVTAAKRGFHELETNIDSMESQIKEQTDELQRLNATLEQQVYKRTQELKAKNKELQEFAYVASHDLQEPLNTVNNFIELLTEEYKDKLGESADEYLSYISDSSARLRKLIQDLLEHSRIGRNETFHDIDCNQLVQVILKDLQPKVDNTQISIKQTNLPIVRGNEADLRLLFQNLISNAIKFRREDVELKVQINAEHKENHYQFSISDNGIGIALNQHEKIFTIFKRLHNRNKYEGTGIGLAHCRKIVEFHSGHIWVESNPDNGCTFYFTLPV